MRLLPDSIRVRLTVTTALAAVLLLAAVLGLGWHYASEAALARGSESLLERQRVVLNGLERWFRRVEASGRELARVIEQQPPQPMLEALLQARIAEDPDIVGVLVALEPGNAYSAGRFARYVSYGPRGVQMLDFNQRKYDFWPRAWYQRGLADAGSWWSQPYFNESSGGQDTITLGQTLHDGAGRPVGVLSIDIALDRVALFAEGLGLVHGQDGRQFTLVADEGRVIMHSDPAFERVASVDTAAHSSGAVTMQVLADRHGDAAQVQRRRGRDGAMLVAEAAMTSPQWRLATAVSEARLLAPLRAAGWQLALAGALAVIVLTLLQSGIARRITRPLQALSQAAAEVARGDFDYPLPVTGRSDELAGLVAAFEHARAALRDSIARLQSAQHEQRRVEGELGAARGIQRAMLPHDRTFFGPALEADVAGVLRPASTVGGDFYGFIAPVPGLFFFYIGDVGERGIPAAMFMTRLAAVLPVMIRHGGSPAELLQRLREQMDLQHEDALSATLLLGRCDLANGELQLASAGHPAPLSLQAGGRQQALAVLPGPPLGDSTRDDGYPLWRGRLTADDRLLLFTNGITDALDADGRPFGLERLQVACARHHDAAPRPLLGQLLDDLVAFIGSAEQQDDFAALLIAVRERA